MSWFEPVHTGQAPAGSSASVRSTMARSAPASNGEAMKGKLKASVQLVAAVAVVGGQLVDGHVGLADEQPRLVVGVGEPPPAPDDSCTSGRLAL